MTESDCGEKHVEDDKGEDTTMFHCTLMLAF